MAAIHLFSDDRATVRALTALLRPHAVLVHRVADRLEPEAVADGGCVLVDMDEPIGWWRAILAERLARPQLPVVLATRRAAVRDVVLAMRLGARTVVDWSADPGELPHALGPLAGEQHGGRARERATDRLAALTPRQRQILALAATGLPSKAIARALALSTRTVEAHRARMVKRLTARSFLELVRQQIRHETGA